MKTTHSTSEKQNEKRGIFTRIVLFTVLVYSSLFALSATTLPSPSPASVESKKTIREYFKFPQILVNHSEVKTVTNNSVEVLFTTNEKGNVNFVLAKTQDESLKHEVEKQFYKLCLPKLKQDVVHSVVLNFKTL